MSFKIKSSIKSGLDKKKKFVRPTEAANKVVEQAFRINLNKA